MTRPPCSCSEFTRKIAEGAILSFELTDQPNTHDGFYWFIAPGMTIACKAVPLSYCPYCGDPVRDVNR